MTILAGGAVIIVLLGLLQYFGSLATGLRVVVGGDPWIDTILQYQPVFKDPAALTNFGLLPFVVPLLLLVPALVPRDLPWRPFFLIWTLAMVLAFIVRRRFALYYGLNIALLAGLTLEWLRVEAARRQWPPSRVIGGGIVLLLALQAPTLAYFAQVRGPELVGLKGDMEEAMLWLDRHTPTAGDPFRPWLPPTYSVMAPWDLGGWLETVGRRPSVATSYGTEAYGMAPLAALMTTEDPAVALKILDAHASRYLVLTNPIDAIPMSAKLAGVRQHYVTLEYDPLLKQQAYHPTADIVKPVAVRLFIADGSMLRGDGFSFAPVAGMRLVYESAGPSALTGIGWVVKKIKIFARCQGLTVTVPGQPGDEVVAEQPVVTNRGRTFSYRTSGMIGPDGVATIMLPYTPGSNGTGVRTIAAARIASKGGGWAIPVDRIVDGGMVHLPRR